MVERATKTTFLGLASFLRLRFRRAWSATDAGRARKLPKF